MIKRTAPKAGSHKDEKRTSQSGAEKGKLERSLTEPREAGAVIDDKRTS